MPMLHINDQSRIALHARVAPFEPMVKPAYCLVTPFDLRTRYRIIRECMIPRSDNCLYRPARLRQHVRYIVAITVEQSPNQKTGNRDFFERTYSLPPERTIMLMFQIEQRPRRRIKSGSQDFFVEGIVRRTCPSLRHVHVELEFVDVRNAIHIVHIVVKTL